MNWGSLVKQIILSSMLSFLVFLMINVAFAQVITSTLLTAADGNTALTIIVFLGMLVALVVAFLVNVMVSEGIFKKRVFVASLFAFLVNIVLWILISYYTIFDTYPDLFISGDSGSLWADVLGRAGLYLGAIPRVMAYYAIYIEGDITRFWMKTLLSYTVIYTFFLYDLERTHARRET